ncbi:VRR-NUC domain-containing protein [Lachnospiraceae bacterium 46-61]
MKESTIESNFVKQVKAMGGMAIKLVSPNFAGLPDRLVLLPHGRMFFVELKATGQKPRPLQIAVHRKLRKLGFDVYVIDSNEKVNELLQSK